MELLQVDGKGYIYLIVSSTVGDERYEYKGCVYDIDSGKEIS